MGREGVGVGDRVITVIGDIARDRKSKTLPLIPLMTLIYTDPIEVRGCAT